MRARMAVSGSAPYSAPMFSFICETCEVAGGRTGYGGMQDHEFEEELRPARALDLDGPFREWVPGEPPKQAFAPKRPVDHESKARFRRQRQQALFRRPVGDVVGKLNRIHARGWPSRAPSDCGGCHATL